MIDQRALTIKLNRVILIEGFQKLAMSKLAAKVNVSRATLYLYFKNKDEIVQAVVARHLRFITERPIPAKFTPASFLQVWLNSLLLMGSTTATFTNDLQRAYPELAEQLRHADQAYFEQLLVYLKAAQQAGFILPTYTSDFVLFQADTLIKGVLQQVRAHQITLNQAQAYLTDSIKLQLTGLMTEQTRQKLDMAAVEPLEKMIINEFRATYALVV